MILNMMFILSKNSVSKTYFLLKPSNSLQGVGKTPTFIVILQRKVSSLKSTGGSLSWIRLLTG